MREMEEHERYLKKRYGERDDDDGDGVEWP